MADRQRVALVFGGQSPEHEVSIKSASKVAGAIDQLEEFSVMPIYVTRRGRWHWGRIEEGRPNEQIVLGAQNESELAKSFQPAGLDFPQALLHLVVDEFATIIIMIHGEGGEDGRLQSAFELAGLRYTGSGSAASALAMDKVRSQSFLRACGLPVSKFIPLHRGENSSHDVAMKVENQIGLPCVIKPALAGSSVGVTIVRDREGLIDAIETAFKYGSLAMAESFVQGREFTCGVIERGGKPEGLPITEIIVPKGRFFDYDAKYTPGVTKEVTPAEIDETLANEMRRIAVEAHKAVGCAGFSRVDFMVGEAGPTILELNTIPGMTETSLLPQAAAAAGIDFRNLVRLIIEHSITACSTGRDSCKHQ